MDCKIREDARSLYDQLTAAKDESFTKGGKGKGKGYKASGDNSSKGGKGKGSLLCFAFVRGRICRITQVSRTTSEQVAYCSFIFFSVGDACMFVAGGYESYGQKRGFENQYGDNKRRLKCFECGGVGHMSNECPSKKNVKGGGKKGSVGTTSEPAPNTVGI